MGQVTIPLSLLKLLVWLSLGLLLRHSKCILTTFMFMLGNKGGDFQLQPPPMYGDVTASLTRLLLILTRGRGEKDIADFLRVMSFIFPFYATVVSVCFVIEWYDNAFTFGYVRVSKATSLVLLLLLLSWTFLIQEWGDILRNLELSRILRAAKGLLQSSGTAQSCHESWSIVEHREYVESNMQPRKHGENIASSTSCNESLPPVPPSHTQEEWKKRREQLVEILRVAQSLMFKGFLLVFTIQCVQATPSLIKQFLWSKYNLEFMRLGSAYAILTDEEEKANWEYWDQVTASSGFENLRGALLLLMAASWWVLFCQFVANAVDCLDKCQKDCVKMSDVPEIMMKNGLPKERKRKLLCCLSLFFMSATLWMFCEHLLNYTVTENPYTIFGVVEDADMKTIKRAYRNITRRLHLVRYPGWYYD